VAVPAGAVCDFASIAQRETCGRSIGGVRRPAPNRGSLAPYSMCVAGRLLLWPVA